MFIIDLLVNTIYKKCPTAPYISTDKLQQFREWKKLQPIKGIKNKSKKRLVSISTVNKILGVFRSIYFMAKDDWKVEVAEINFKKVFFPPKDRTVEYLTKEQVDQIIKRAKERHTKDMVKFAFYTGFRWSNISHLKWEEIDMDKRIILVRTKSVKEGGQLMYFQIHDELYNFLNELPTKEGFVFQRNGKQVKSIKKSFANACERCGITLPMGQNVHILRHSAITYLLEQGVPPHIVKDIVGHNNINTTMRYTHVISDVKRKALNNAFRSKNGQRQNKKEGEQML